MALIIKTKEKKPMYFEVNLEGRLDMDSHAQLQKAIDFLFESKIMGLQLDLSGLEYINSMGLRVLFTTAKKAKAVGATFLLSRPQPQVKAILDIANALPSESIFTSIEEADRYFDAIQKGAMEEGA